MDQKISNFCQELKNALDNKEWEKTPLITSLADHFEFNKKDINQLLEAFTHSSFLNEVKVPWNSYNRLEFLGDQILSLYAGLYVYNKFPKDSEGKLTLKKNHLVNNNALKKYSTKLGLDNYLLKGKGVPIEDKILADIFESYLGAVYLTKGSVACEGFLIELFAQEDLFAGKKFKTLLQEYCQKRYQSLPEYIVTDKNEKNISIELKTPFNKTINVTETSRKKAEERAAEIILEEINYVN